jgi:hypothetical protein
VLPNPPTLAQVISLLNAVEGDFSFCAAALQLFYCCYASGAVVMTDVMKRMFLL